MLDSESASFFELHHHGSSHFAHLLYRPQSDADCLKWISVFVFDGAVVAIIGFPVEGVLLSSDQEVVPHFLSHYSHQEFAQKTLFSLEERRPTVLAVEQMKFPGEGVVHDNSPVVVSDLGACRVLLVFIRDFFTRDPKKVIDMKVQVSNILETASIPKQKEVVPFFFNLNQKRRSNFGQGLVLEAQARLGRSISRKQEEAFGLGVGEVSLVEMTDHSPVIERVELLTQKELLIQLA